MWLSFARRTSVQLTLGAVVTAALTFGAYQLTNTLVGRSIALGAWMPALLGIVGLLASQLYRPVKR
jgi:hypothetical protein